MTALPEQTEFTHMLATLTRKVPSSLPAARCVVQSFPTVFSVVMLSLAVSVTISNGGTTFALRCSGVRLAEDQQLWGRSLFLDYCSCSGACSAGSCVLAQSERLVCPCRGRSLVSAWRKADERRDPRTSSSWWERCWTMQQILCFVQVSFLLCVRVMTSRQGLTP